MHADLAWLESSPFNDFLIPGLVLFFAVRGNAFYAGIAILRRWRFPYEAAFIAGAMVFGWMSIQVLIINSANALHYIY
jgi:hypothetical protein